VCFAFSATDAELDIKQVVLLQQDHAQTIGPDIINLPEQYMESQVYSGSITAEYAGNWAIQAYLVDAEGNESNKVIKTIIVNKKPITYAATFNTNGGSEIQSVTGLASGSTITKPEDPSKPGFVFDGWYKDAQYAKAWDFDNDVVSVNVTLYAKWLQNKIVYQSCPARGLPEGQIEWFPEPSEQNKNYSMLHRRLLLCPFSGEHRACSWLFPDRFQPSVDVSRIEFPDMVSQRVTGEGQLFFPYPVIEGRVAYAGVFRGLLCV
jgi:uncharacterized repeat protein (TIGR02543 family)